ncbi:MAG: DegT/DnrJ/EryC1/StrS family aminotransferase [Ignavibacteria bacterium]|nr:DegT/DnrJ/EryC1/StrS family aminotransferase [Ignavibacteria bacterium]
MREPIPIGKTYFDEDDLNAVSRPLKDGWVLQGKFVKEFEDSFSKFTNAKNSIAVSSCSTALQLVLSTFGLKDGDEVIVPSFTWIATANAVEYTGAKPVFIDIDLATFNIDVNKIEEKITPRTKGIIAVHLFGLCADMDVVKNIAQKYSLFVVEDAACALGSYYKGRHCGTFGDYGCFSFHPRKSITTGEGGMITTNDNDKDALCRSLRNHGASDKKDLPFLLTDYDNLGYNFRMTDIQGALGVSQMKKIDFLLSERKRIAGLYDKYLKDIKFLNLPAAGKDYIHSYQSYVCLFAPEKINERNIDKIFNQRNDLMKKLDDAGIMTRQGTHSAAYQGYYKKKYSYSNADCFNSLVAEKCSIALPLFPGLSDEDVSYIASKLRTNNL